MSAAEVNAAQNTDRELYREPWPDPPGDFYAPSIHVTARGGIGISVGGTCFVMPLKAWHELAKQRGVESLRGGLGEVQKPPEASSGTPSGGEQAPNPGSGAATDCLRCGHHIGWHCEDGIGTRLMPNDCNHSFCNCIGYFAP